MNQEGTCRIVYTSGTWDLFHLGHLRILERARRMADVLIVGVSTDTLIQRYKGHPPVESFSIRYDVVCQVDFADLVIPQVQQFHVERMRQLRVTHVVVGDDWKGDSRTDELSKYVEVVFLPRTPGVCSSELRKVLYP